MELWVRSQDKECLMKINRMDYDLSNGEHRIMVDGYKSLIGKYETKKRALEVLDEIQERIIELDKAVIYSHVSEEDYLNVYEMPEE